MKPPVGLVSVNPRLLGVGLSAYSLRDGGEDLPHGHDTRDELDHLAKRFTFDGDHLDLA